MESGAACSDDDQQWGSIMSKILTWVFRHYVEIVFSAALLVSTSAHAGPSRSLSLATAETAPQTEPSQPASNALQAAPKATAPVATTPEAKPPVTSQPMTAGRPTKRHAMTESRIIYELHRHGIYWLGTQQ
jgi:hypothetical protein